MRKEGSNNGFFGEVIWTAEVMSLNELGIQSLEQATMATNGWIDECLHTCVDDMFEGLDQIALLCFQARQEAKKRTKESDKSEISRYRVRVLYLSRLVG